MASIAIVTDSASCLPQEIKNDYEIEVISFNIHSQGKTYQDGVNITPQQVYSLQRAGETLTTSAPSPGIFAESFQRLAQKSGEILCLSVASSYSAFPPSIQSAIDIVKKQSPKLRIELIDCYIGSAAQALITLTAAHASRLGKNLNEIISKIHQAIPRAEINLVLDTLKYLKKGGRVPKVGAWTTSLLELKPVVTNRMGHAHLVGVGRSRTQGIEQLVKAMKKG